MATCREERDKWLEGANGDGGSVSVSVEHEDHEDVENHETEHSGVATKYFYHCA